MKYTCKMMALLLLPLFSMAGEGFVIKGKVTGIISGSVVIQDHSHDGDNGKHEAIPPKVRIVNGEFTYAGKLDHPEIISLKISTRVISIFLENANYTINCSLDSLSSERVIGGKLNAQWCEFRKSPKPPLEYVKAHPKEELGAWIGHTFAVKQDDAQMVYDQLTPEAKNSFDGKALRDRIETYKKTSAGSPLPQFKMTDPNGKPVSIKDLAGKVVVLDFWASWCAPCRVYIPTLREYYNKYKDKGVVFISVSLDDDPAKWQKAMDELKMEWTQVLAEGGFKEEAGVRKLFNIAGIPYVVVVGKDGKMAASMDYYQKQHLEALLQKLL